MTVGKSVTLGLFAAWLVHDLEEWFTIGPWSRNHVRPDSGAARWTGLRWLRAGVSDAEVHVGITLVGALVAAAAIAGAGTRGGSRFFQGSLAAFGLHGFGHLALSAAFRGYTPCVATSPTGNSNSSACTVSSVSISKPPENAGNDFTKRRDIAR